MTFSRNEKWVWRGVGGWGVCVRRGCGAGVCVWGGGVGRGCGEGVWGGGVGRGCGAGVCVCVWRGGLRCVCGEGLARVCVLGGGGAGGRWSWGEGVELGCVCEYYDRKRHAITKSYCIIIC